MYELFQTIEEEGIVPNSFYKGTLTSISKLDKDRREENYRPVLFVNLDAKISVNQKRLHIMTTWVYPRNARVI